MANLICIDTSTEICSVCCGNNSGVLHLSEIDKKNSHTETITLQIKECLDGAGWLFGDLEGVVISEGPGSYTGLRVGTSAAKGIAYALDIHLIGIPTLMGLAEGVRHLCNDNDIIMPMIDARRMEVYTAVYNNALSPLKDTHSLILDESIFDAFQVAGKIVLCGNGCIKAKELKLPENIKILPTICTSTSLLPLALKYFKEEKFENIYDYDPTYLKNPNVTKSKKKYF